MTTTSKITTRQLGKNGPQVPRIGMGLMPLSGVYGVPASDEERLAFIVRAYELGQTFWDAADEYNDSEDLIGKWFAANPEKRKDIFLATKFGIRGKPSTELSRLRIDSFPEYARQAIEKSLGRLGVSHIDLYHVHGLDKITPIEKTIEALVELKQTGKIRHIGLSECSAFGLAIESPQIRLLEAARELGVAVVAYSPLGMGVLRRNCNSKPEDNRI